MIVDLDKLWSLSGLKRLKTNQDLPVCVGTNYYLFVDWSVGMHVKASKTATARAKQQWQYYFYGEFHLFE